MREGFTKASGTPFVGGHVDVRPVGRISRVAFRKTWELTNQLPARPGGATPADHSCAHRRIRGGTIGERRRVNDESCASKNGAQRRPEALGYTGDKTVSRGQEVHTDLNPAIGHRSRSNATTRSLAS